MHIVVTGAAGFVGSHLTEELVRLGHQVTAIDCLLPDSYPARIKAERLTRLGRLPQVSPHQIDLRTAELEPVIEGADVVINEAAMPGLMKSWSEFSLYTSCNLLAVDRLIRASQQVGIGRFVQISTSSVYGQIASGDEDSPTQPFSPYGVSKLAAEKLVLAHVANFDFPAVVLRYFSIFGPGQRPDMGYSLFCEALLDERSITVYGDGQQTRSNTFVSDAVAATIAALTHGESGAVLNIAGGESISLLRAIEVLADELGIVARLEFAAPRPGDQRDTRGDTRRARSVLEWRPLVATEDGLRRQARWHRERRLTTASAPPPQIP